MGKINLDSYRFIESHLQRKCANEWLYDCVAEGQSKKFPYRIAKKRKGTVQYQSLCYPAERSALYPQKKAGVSCFLINIPEGRGPLRQISDERYLTLLHRLATQSFSTTAAASSRMQKSRLCAVIGTNQIESLDSKLNRKFTKHIQATKPSTTFALRRIGFLWRPEYECLTDNKKIYSVKKSFSLLQAHSKVQAEKVRALVEGSGGKLSSRAIKQIPYQQIRQTILKSRETNAFADWYQTHARDSCVYLTVMDADFQNLRIIEGIFSKITREINPSSPQSVIGCGYGVLPTELPVIQLAVEIDMAVRDAMTKCVPYGAYLPEPCLAVLLKKPNERHHLIHLSFKGNGSSLESRRLIENGRSLNIFTDQMTFFPQGIITSAPSRWKTKKNKSIPELNTNNIKTKRVLQALRGLSQSHAHPKKWADQLYLALDFTSSQITDATGPMMHIFDVYDPISRIFSATRVTRQIFDQEIGHYERALTKDEVNELNLAKRRLEKLKMPKELIDRIEIAAQASGKAIHEKLLSFVSS